MTRERHDVQRKGEWWACSCGAGGRGSEQGHSRTPGLTFVYPPNTWAEPPEDRRMWLPTLVVTPLVARLQECKREPGEWALLAASNRPENTAWRVRRGRYAVTRTGTWEAVQRAQKHQPGFADIYARYLGDE